MPDMVQIGNEIINGMLWPDGKLPDQLGQLRRPGEGRNPRRRCRARRCQRPRIMIHIDQGGNKKRTKCFFDKLNSYGVDYDVIGQSYYPWWHGTLLGPARKPDLHGQRVQKGHHPGGSGLLLAAHRIQKQNAPFPETPEGQKEFLDEVNRIVLATPDNRGIGIFWWEPAVTGGLRSRGFFDNDGNALPVITVFDKFTRK